MKVIEQSHASPMVPSKNLQGVYMRWFGVGKILQDLNLSSCTGYALDASYLWSGSFYTIMSIECTSSSIHGIFSICHS